jgi:hypothetical protein
MLEHGTFLVPTLSAGRYTIQAARLLRAEKDLGSVEAGKYADLVAVLRDPLADVTALQDVAFRNEGRSRRQAALTLSVCTRDPVAGRARSVCNPLDRPPLGLQNPGAFPSHADVPGRPFDLPPRGRAPISRTLPAAGDPEIRERKED